MYANAWTAKEEHYERKDANATKKQKELLQNETYVVASVNAVQERLRLQGQASSSSSSSSSSTTTHTPSTCTMMEGLQSNDASEREKKYVILRPMIAASKLLIDQIQKDFKQQQESTTTYVEYFTGFIQLELKNNADAKQITSIVGDQSCGTAEMDMNDALYLYSRINLTKDQYGAVRNIQSDLLKGTGGPIQSPILMPPWHRFVLHTESIFPKRVDDGLICAPKPITHYNSHEDRWDGCCRHVKHGPCGTMQWDKKPIDTEVSYTPGSAWRMGASIQAELDGFLFPVLVAAAILAQGVHWYESHRLVLQVMTGCDGTAHKGGTCAQ